MFTLFLLEGNIKHDFFRSNGLEKSLPKVVVVALNRKESLHQVQWFFSDGETTSERVQKKITQN